MKREPPAELRVAEKLKGEWVLASKRYGLEVFYRCPNTPRWTRLHDEEGAMYCIACGKNHPLPTGDPPDWTYRAGGLLSPQILLVCRMCGDTKNVHERILEIDGGCRCDHCDKYYRFPKDSKRKCALL